jgi:hypothetical protein
MPLNSLFKPGHGVCQGFSGFAALGYVQHPQSAMPDEERHGSVKENDRVSLILSRLPMGGVKVGLVTILQ